MTASQVGEMPATRLPFKSAMSWIDEAGGTTSTEVQGAFTCAMIRMGAPLAIAAITAVGHAQ